jgi:hypothetical protein
LSPNEPIQNFTRAPCSLSKFQIKSFGGARTVAQPRAGTPLASE